MVRCQKHGIMGAILACPHLSENVWRFKPIRNFEKRVDEDKSNIEDEWRIDFKYLLCNICSKKYQKSLIEQFPEHFIGISCAKCFKELSEF